MKEAHTYSDWKKCADERDALTGRAAWKDTPESVLYDWRRIQIMTEEIRRLNTESDIPEIMRYMRSRLMRNIAGLGNKHLFVELKAGTKSLIEEFHSEVVLFFNALARL
uniref:Triacylglycerol lipase N-terminal domain-containing protein n=1 Tax=Spongospora subterranea TaxID=70186 RepID=A0A0H5QWR4_9EUKA|eukprot:CRZ06405.1 hypothetical protein [Spongospora subterranea]